MGRGRAIIYIPKGAGSRDVSQSILESISQYVAVEIVRSISDLKRQFLPHLDEPRPIVIALVPSKVDLQNLLEVQELLENTRLILGLPETDNEMVALAHSMRPRFIGYLANGFADIAAVARKMVGETRVADE